MNLEKTKPIHALLSALNHIRAQPFLLVVSSIIDAFFFIAYGFLTTPVLDRIVAQSVLITNELGKAWAAGPTAGLLKLLILDPIKPLTGKLLILLGILFIVTFLVWVIFQGSSWYFCRHLAKKPVSYKKYLLGFARINLIWIAAYILYKLLDAIIGLRFVLIKKFEPAAINILGTALDALFVLLIITALYSYPSLRELALFRKKITHTLTHLALCATLYFASTFIINQIAKIHLEAGFIAGVVILFPIITLIKTYTIEMAFDK